MDQEGVVDDTELTGRCLCGAIRYRVTGTPMHRTLCHCENCRRATGGQAVAWVTFPADRFRYLQGEPSRHLSETRATWSFCGACGTTLAYTNERRPNEVDLTVASLDSPEDFAPTQDVFAEDRLSWVPLVASKPA
jgi:hypothetical protein